MIGEAFGFGQVVFWTKILLMPLLLLGMLRGLNPKEITPAIKFAILALICSTAGDLFLLNEKTSDQVIFFYLGLGSFMLAQVCYIFSFMRLGNIPIRSTWFIAYAVYFAVFMWMLYPVMAPILLIAVAVYGLTLSGMAWNSWRTWDNKSKFQWAGIIGAILFLASDSLLAINRFKFQIPLAGFWIMSTYITAQYLIIRSITRKSISNQAIP